MFSPHENVKHWMESGGGASTTRLNRNGVQCFVTANTSGNVMQNMLLMKGEFSHGEYWNVEVNSV